MDKTLIKDFSRIDISKFLKETKNTEKVKKLKWYNVISIIWIIIFLVISLFSLGVIDYYYSFNISDYALLFFPIVGFLSYLLTRLIQFHLIFKEEILFYISMNNENSFGRKLINAINKNDIISFYELIKSESEDNNLNTYTKIFEFIIDNYFYFNISDLHYIHLESVFDEIEEINKKNEKNKNLLIFNKKELLECFYIDISKENFSVWLACVKNFIKIGKKYDISTEKIINSFIRELDGKDFNLKDYYEIIFIFFSQLNGEYSDHLYYEEVSGNFTDYSIIIDAALEIPKEIVVKLFSLLETGLTEDFIKENDKKGIISNSIKGFLQQGNLNKDSNEYKVLKNILLIYEGIFSQRESEYELALKKGDFHTVRFYIENYSFSKIPINIKGIQEVSKSNIKSIFDFIDFLKSRDVFQEFYEYLYIILKQKKSLELSISETIKSQEKNSLLQDIGEIYAKYILDFGKFPIIEDYTIFSYNKERETIDFSIQVLLNDIKKIKKNLDKISKQLGYVFSIQNLDKKGYHQDKDIYEIIFTKNITDKNKINLIEKIISNIKFEEEFFMFSELQNKIFEKNKIKVQEIFEVQKRILMDDHNNKIQIDYELHFHNHSTKDLLESILKDFSFHLTFNNNSSIPKLSLQIEKDKIKTGSQQSKKTINF